VTQPTVSVIIANYNRAHLLEQAIQSVVDQTYQGYELVVFDDGSHDHSFEVIEQYKKIIPDKMHLFTHEGRANRGIVATYLEAIALSRGKNIAFLEHDDRWSSNYLEQKVKVLDQHPEVGVVFSPYKVVSEGWFGKDMMLRQMLLRLTIKSGKPFDNFTNLLQSNNVATFSCFMTRKNLLEDLPIPPEKILAFDWWVLTQLSQRSLFYFDKSSFTHWRWTRESAIGRQKFKEHKREGCEYMQLMYSQVKRCSEQLPENKKETFVEYQQDFEYFVDYYRNPSIVRFFKFFIRAPIWALAATASLIINFLKFR
jgi:glycosyltransferase involved in cell wall biosynthesis